MTSREHKKHYFYTVYLETRVAKLIATSVEYKKRHYKNKIRGILGTGFTLAAIKMAGKAILELMKIKTYKDSILKGMYDSLKLLSRVCKVKQSNKTI